MAPSVGITTPSESATVAAGFSISATANDNVAIKSVAFYLDGDLLGTATAPPYQLTIDHDLAAGAHTIVVEATDPAGNTATDQRDVTVAAPASAAADSMGMGCSAGGEPPTAALALGLVALLRRSRRRRG